MIRIGLSVLFLFSFLQLFCCCSSSQKEYQTLSVEAFEALIGNEQIQRLDVRTADEYVEGHIPGSLLVDVLQDDFTALAELKLDKKRPVALYCKSGNRSKKAASILTAKGFEVYELAGGFTAWRNAGLDVE